MRSSDLSHATWRKSSHSNDGGYGDCIEVATLPNLVAVRDSKHPAGPALALTHPEWRAFLSTVQSGELA